MLGCLGYSRAGAAALVFFKEILDLLFGIRRCVWRLGALPQTLVWDRQAGLHAGGGRPTEAFAAFCGRGLECQIAVLVVANPSRRVDDHHAAVAVGVLGLPAARLDHYLEHTRGGGLEEDAMRVRRGNHAVELGRP